MASSKLLDDVRSIIRVKNHSYRTEKSYIYWIRKYILYHKKTHPLRMAEKEIDQFINFLALKQKVSASTQDEALRSMVTIFELCKSS